MSRNHIYDQHFLRSPRLVAELVGHSSIGRRDTVVDFGAGSGVITSVLARRAARVIAVEVEPEALQKLRTHMAESANVRIVNKDMISVELPDSPYKVFSNIPFRHSAQMVQRLCMATHPPDDIYLIVQRQFARKLIDSPTHFTSLLGAQLAPWWSARIRRPLRRHDFTPPPAVDTVLLQLKPRAEALLGRDEQAEFAEFVGAAFRHQPTMARMPLAEAGISPERKPSELSVNEWVRLYELTRR